MTKNEIIRELKSNLTILYTGHCQWTIGSRIDAGGETLYLSMKTNDEEDKTGIFDGEKYNPLLGCKSKTEIKEQFGLRNWGEVHDIMRKQWSDPANEDNYEPVEERDLRLATRLYDEREEQIEQFLSGNTDNDLL